MLTLKTCLYQLDQSGPYHHLWILISVFIGSCELGIILNNNKILMIDYTSISTYIMARSFMLQLKIEYSDPRPNSDVEPFICQT